MTVQRILYALAIFLGLLFVPAASKSVAYVTDLAIPHAVSTSQTENQDSTSGDSSEEMKGLLHEIIKLLK